MNESTERIAVFTPEVFEVADLDKAKGVILTGEPGTTTDERWAKETPFLAADIAEQLALNAESRVLDYGCGIGRIAKELIEKCGCRVIGVDASRAMRELAPGYVLSDRFIIWSPEVLEQMLKRGLQFDCAISLWVIQHVLDPEHVIRQIESSLPASGLFYALNQRSRCVPTDQGWVSDGFDVLTALAAVFTELDRYPLPDSVATPLLANQSSIQVLRRRS
ncbi:MAG TPA: class I SAM-dependent methyltransferase [Pirellulales bacterium]|nr:class I SAM-dependent methyltransferase [Pirellulales bacterium]